MEGFPHPWNSIYLTSVSTLTTCSSAQAILPLILHSSCTLSQAITQIINAFLATGTFQRLGLHQCLWSLYCNYRRCRAASLPSSAIFNQMSDMLSLNYILDVTSLASEVIIFMSVLVSSPCLTASPRFCSQAFAFLNLYYIPGLYWSLTLPWLFQLLLCGYPTLINCNFALLSDIRRMKILVSPKQNFHSS